MLERMGCATGHMECKLEDSRERLGLDLELAGGKREREGLRL